MKVLWVVSLYVHEQPSPEVWQRLVAVVAQWRERGGTPLDESLPFMRMGALPSQDEAERLVACLRGIPGAQVHLARSQRHEAQDFSTADFVTLSAAPRGIEVVRNAPAALSAPRACARCGLADEFDVTFRRPFVVDATLMDGDVWNLPGGALAVSERFVELLRATGAQGFDTEPLVEASGYRPSKTWHQLLAEQAVLVPCPTHTRVHGGDFCTECGRAHGTVEGDVWLKPQQVEGLDVVSRHPGCRAMFYFSRRVLQGLKDEGLVGFEPHDLFRLCRH